MNDVPKLPGVDTGWHDLSHHGQDAQKIQELKLIEEAEFREISGLLTLLRNAKEAGGSVLDSTHLLILSRQQSQLAGSAGDSRRRRFPARPAHRGWRQRQRQRPPVQPVRADRAADGRRNRTIRQQRRHQRGRVGVTVRVPVLASLRFAA